MKQKNLLYLFFQSLVTVPVWLEWGKHFWKEGWALKCCGNMSAVIFRFGRWLQEKHFFGSLSENTIFMQSTLLKYTSLRSDKNRWFCFLQSFFTVLTRGLISDWLPVSLQDICGQHTHTDTHVWHSQALNNNNRCQWSVGSLQLWQMAPL